MTSVPRATLDEIVTDLDAERAAVLALVESAGHDSWHEPTPAQGWTVRDQVAHLVASDRLAVTALTDPDRFAQLRQEALPDLAGFEQRARQVVEADFDEAVAAWRAVGHELTCALRGCRPNARVAWFGPSMSVMSLATARLMETWAHGRDIADAVGRTLVSTDRLRHVAALGYRARGYGYHIRGRQPPTSDVRVDLVLPSGARWSAGPPQAAQRISGSAEDFCLVLVRRRRVVDTTLTVEGPDANEWMRIGQMFAGPPGDDPPPLRRSARTVHRQRAGRSNPAAKQPHSSSRQDVG